LEAIPSQLFLGAVVLNRAAPEVLALRIEIYRKLKKWGIDAGNCQKAQRLSAE